MINLWLDETIIGWSEITQRTDITSSTGSPPPGPDTCDLLIRHPALLQLTHLALWTLQLEAWKREQDVDIKGFLLNVFTFITLKHQQSVLQDSPIITRSIIQKPICNLFMLWAYLDWRRFQYLDTAHYSDRISHLYKGCRWTRSPCPRWGKAPRTPWTPRHRSSHPRPWLVTLGSPRSLLVIMLSIPVTQQCVHLCRVPTTIHYSAVASNIQGWDHYNTMQNGVFFLFKCF